MSNPRITELHGMTEPPCPGLPGWEAEWVLFGPIPNPGYDATWPGEIGFKPLLLDGATETPAEIDILGRAYTACQTISKGGVIRFSEVFGPQPGLPIVYMMTTLIAERDGVAPVSFGANWGAQWWVNGTLVCQTLVGNFMDSESRVGNQFLAPVKAGANLVVVKVIAGDSDGGMITLSHLPVREPAEGSEGTEPATATQEPAVAEAPVRDYTQAGLRIEERPGPVSEARSVMQERMMAEHGVKAHWIGVVDDDGVPFAGSAVLPSGPATKPENGDLLRRQVEEIHRNGMSAITWYPAMNCKSAAIAHPEWRSRLLCAAGADVTPDGDDAAALRQEDYVLCPNSPYGDALIAFVNETIDRYGVDGFWFDSTCRGVGHDPACVCEHCGRRFREAEGMELPAHFDWNDPVFRRWVLWRYRDYMDFWAKLAREARCGRPHVRIAVNHMHRLCHTWQAGIPLESYDADIVAATESMADPFVSAFHARQQRAYGRPEAEVWMGLHKLFPGTEFWPPEMKPVYRYMHHAMSCMTAGVMPSFGTEDVVEKTVGAYDLLSRLINPRRPLVGGESVPYAAILLSQQAEAFHFSRRDDRGFPLDYWHSVVGWHHLLMEKQLLQEVVFDDIIDSGRLAAYPVFVVPCAVALSDRQVAALEDYVRAGGVLVAGADLGTCDEWGERADSERVAGILGQAAAAPPDPNEGLLDPKPEVVTRSVGRGQVIRVNGNVGLQFMRARSARLADEVAELLRSCALPPVDIEGPRRIHIGMFRRDGRCLLHVQNFIAHSEPESFPNPGLTCPEPLGDLRVTFRGLPVARATLPLAEGNPELMLTRQSNSVTFSIPKIKWGEVVALHEKVHSVPVFLT